MYFIQEINGKRIYKLTEMECKNFGRVYPTFCYWQSNDDIGNMLLTENEAESIKELIRQGV